MTTKYDWYEVDDFYTQPQKWLTPKRYSDRGLPATDHTHHDDTLLATQGHIKWVITQFERIMATASGISQHQPPRQRLIMNDNSD